MRGKMRRHRAGVVFRPTAAKGNFRWQFFRWSLSTGNFTVSAIKESGPLQTAQTGSLSQKPIGANDTECDSLFSKTGFGCSAECRLGTIFATMSGFRATETSGNKLFQKRCGRRGEGTALWFSKTDFGFWAEQSAPVVETKRRLGFSTMFGHRLTG